MKRYLTKILKACICCVIALSTSCRDDLLYNPNEIGEGEGKISFTMRFEPIVPALEETRTAGNAIKNIENLSVVVFKKDTTLYQIYRSDNGELLDYDVNYVNDFLAPDRPSGTKTTEKGTAVAKFSLANIPYGEYYFYVVANIDLDENEIESPYDLKKSQVQWVLDWNSDNANSEEYLSNKAMFGYFRANDSEGTLKFDAPLVRIDKGQVDLYAWIRRLASKVTVAFDPSGLEESVHIYIKSVTIHDIPKSCYLGQDNTPDNMDQLYPIGETIPYYKEGDENNIDGWLHLMKGTKVTPKHADEDDALFFFENMQGNYEGQQDYYKPQIYGKTGQSINSAVEDKDGNIINDYKDKVKYGTYIEVKAYYDSRNEKNFTSGPITYRFMMGQNTTYNYNAERNHHYKLTLKFNGWANEPDWHIVYDEGTPTIFLPNKYYISYLYNQSMGLPVRIKGLTEQQRQIWYLHSEIIENNWIPYDTETHSAPRPAIGESDDINGFAWNQTAYEQIYSYVENGVRKPYNYVGFLSVRKSNETIVGNTMTFGQPANEALEKYYNGEECEFGQVNPRGEAYYYLNNAGDNKIDMIPGSVGDADDGTYNVSYIDNDIIMKVPFYTRAKELVSVSDFTGNNPYYAYQRKAVVRFTLREIGTDKIVPFKVIDMDGVEKEETKKDIPIYQVRRIVNPKAIWRAHDSEEPFHVKLMHLENGGAETFVPFESEGKWRVSVINDDDNLILINGSTLKDGEYYSPETETGSFIEFDYKPNGTIDKDKTRCGIIKVEYHDYSCIHLIFVRQGYDAPVHLGDADWSCYNAVATSGNGNYLPQQKDETMTTYVKVTESPLSIGSFFKRCQYNYAILEKNNVTPAAGWLVNIDNVNVVTASLNGTNNTYQETDATWKDFGGYAWYNYGGDRNEPRKVQSWGTKWEAVNLDEGLESSLTVPTLDNYRNLRDNCEFGYGIVYGDGSSTVATNVNDAQGFIDTDYDGKDDVTGEARGMRVCIVYNPKNGDHILFPLGAIGQARRVRTMGGALSYGGLTGLLTGNRNMYRPITYNLYRSPGAGYWFKQPGTKEYSPDGEAKDIAAWDINYYSLVFNPYAYNTLGAMKSDGNPEKIDGNGNAEAYGLSSDALPIKLIYRKD